MPRSYQRPLAFVLAVAAPVLLVGTAARAGTSRTSRGDAQAVFEAGPAGGDAIRVHSGNQVGPASANGIRISGFVDDRHYCSLDWHLIAVDLFDGNLPGESPRTPHEIATALSALAIASYVDGVRLDTVRTPVKPMTDPEGLGLVNGFWFATGRVMAPSDLSVGAHTLRTELTNAGVLVETDQVTFVIDPPGVGACV